MSVRIGAVSPMDNAMEAIGAAFAEQWPEAELFHVLDESLYLDFAGGKAQTSVSIAPPSPSATRSNPGRCGGPPGRA